MAYHTCRRHTRPLNLLIGEKMTEVNERQVHGELLVVDLNELERLAQAATAGPWFLVLKGIKRIESAKEFVGEAGGLELKDAEFITAANPAVVQVLIEHMRRLMSSTTMQDAVTCVFDQLKMAACNTSGKEWSEELEDLAEDVIEYAPRYKRRWKDICQLAAEVTRLKDEVETLRKLPGTVANEYSQLLLDEGLSKPKAETYQQRMNAAMEVQRRMQDVTRAGTAEAAREEEKEHE